METDVTTIFETSVTETTFETVVSDTDEVTVLLRIEHTVNLIFSILIMLILVRFLWSVLWNWFFSKA